MFNAHVDSVNVFRFIEEILSKPRNNPTHTFERFSDIEGWLREQWAGYFRELLQRQSQQQQLSALGAQVSELKAVNETLRKYLEAVMTGITPADSSRLIESEQRRLQELERNERIKENQWCRHVLRSREKMFGQFLEAMIKATSFTDFTKRMSAGKGSEEIDQRNLLGTLLHFEEARHDFNQLRKFLGLKPIRPKRSEMSNFEGLRKDS